MKTYSVKQIAEKLGTNPETIRRWIRDEKLKAVQVSRKNGNIVTEDELNRFIKSTPKYLSKISTGLNLIANSPAVGIGGALVGGIVASALLRYYEENNTKDVQVRPEDFKVFLNENIKKLDTTIQQKQKLILQTEEEIKQISKQIEQYNYLLENEDMLVGTLTATTNIKE